MRRKSTRWLTMKYPKNSTVLLLSLQHSSKLKIQPILYFLRFIILATFFIFGNFILFDIFSFLVIKQSFKVLPSPIFILLYTLYSILYNKILYYTLNIRITLKEISKLNLKIKISKMKRTMSSKK